MSRIDRVTPEFVDEVPRELSVGSLYISIPYATAVHLCCCGCGHEVVTPIHPTRWALTYDGESVSLSPSVGSWGLPCRSHYVIRKNRVRWASQWSKAEIEAGRARERLDAEDFFARKDPEPNRTRANDTGHAAGVLRRIRRRFAK